MTDAAAPGTTFGAPTAGEVALAEEVCRRVEAVEMMRMTSSGTEAAMSAIRLARAATGRERLLKFAGAYHGHVDGLLAEGGLGPGHAGDPLERGRARGGGGHDADRCLERPGARWRRRSPPSRSRPSSPSRGRPTWASSRPRPSFLAALRRLADESGALLVFDEVITGFRVSPGGAQELADVTPDLTIMGKVIGGGLPAAAYGGSVELMERVAPAGDVYQAGTLSGNPLAVAAGLATLELLDDAAYARLSTLTAELAAALREAAAEPRAGAGRVRARPAHRVLLRGPGHRLCRRRGLRPRGPCGSGAGRCSLAASTRPPSQFEAWFPSLAHGEEHVARTAEAAAAAFAEVAG